MQIVRAQARAFIAVSLVLLLADAAWAMASAPLARVRITEDLTEHTPSVGYVRDVRKTRALEVRQALYGLRYTLQTEWASGWGLLAALGVARADMHARLDMGGQQSAPFEAVGWSASPELRVYRMLWISARPTASADSARPSAVTAFAGARMVHGSVSDADAQARFESSSLRVTAGVGLMAEWAFSSYVSVLPYVWLAPDVYRRAEYRVEGRGSLVDAHGFSLRQPLRAGLDVWVYPFGVASDAHVALSTVLSLFDADGRGNQEMSFVLSYTF